MLIKNFAPTGALVFALDDTIERRRGERIKAKGIYRDPVRSSHSHFVKASGLRWLCLMLTVPIPWAERVWALPILTCLCPSERYYEGRRRPHKKLTEWARQMLQQVKRWLPEREMVVVADSTFAALELLEAVRREITVITRLRLDAALYEPAPVRRPREKLMKDQSDQVTEPRESAREPRATQHWWHHPRRVQKQSGALEVAAKEEHGNEGGGDNLSIRELTARVFAVLHGLEQIVNETVYCRSTVVHPRSPFLWLFVWQQKFRKGLFVFKELSVSN